ncbi:MAG: anti-sigma factor antagonist, partial [Chloroflexota bacterium]
MPLLEIGATRADATLTLRVAGRLDANAAPELAAAIPADPALRRLVLDLGACPYVSSGGIREVLAAHKRLVPLGGAVGLVNVQPEVLRVFDLTGLTQLMTIREKPREISVEGLEYLAEGVFGEVFRIDDETIVKLYREGVDPAVVEKEKAFAKAAFVAGIPTAISLDVVSAGPRFGVVYELLRAESLAALMRRAPDRLDDHARLLAGLARTIHATEADPAIFPDMKADAAGWISDMAHHFTPDD